MGSLGGTTIAGGGLVLGQSVLEQSILLGLGHGIALECDDTKFVFLHRVLIHESTRIDGAHLGAHQGTELLEFTRSVLNATPLRQANEVISSAHVLSSVAELYSQDGKTIVSEVLNLLVPAGGLEVAVAPRVVVESKEVRAHVITAAVHVHGGLHSIGGHICG